MPDGGHYFLNLLRVILTWGALFPSEGFFNVHFSIIKAVFLFELENVKRVYTVDLIQFVPNNEEPSVW